MKIVIAPDSFKGSLTAKEVGEAIQAGLKQVWPDAEYVLVPMADGGEGTVQALVDATGGRFVTRTVTGPLGLPVAARYGLLGQGQTAVIELAAGALAPVLEALGIPPETVGLLLVRPVSGSAALGVGADLITTYGPDSLVGRTAAVMLGSTETTFYTIAVYFGAAGIVKTRYAVPAALCADLTGFLAASWAVRLLFGA